MGDKVGLRLLAFAAQRLLTKSVPRANLSKQERFAPFVIQDCLNPNTDNLSLANFFHPFGNQITGSVLD
jgi:hypothetical protein